MMTRFVGVVGRDFCGSTMLLRLLSCLDGVGTGGELHWLIDVPPLGILRAAAGWSFTRYCVVHGKSCPVFTPAFVTAPRGPKSLYREVAAQMQVPILVTTDKYVGHYRDFTRKGELEAIVLFKEPLGQARSDMRHHKRAPTTAIKQWTETYEQIMHWTEVEHYPKRAVYVPYVRLTADPFATLASICLVLGLPAPPEDITARFARAASERTYHCIGGNPQALERTTIETDEQWKRELEAVTIPPGTAEVRRRLYALAGQPLP